MQTDALSAVPSTALFGFSDLVAARELIPPQKGETLKTWVERCYLAGIVGGFEMENIRNLNQQLWNEPYMIEPNVQGHRSLAVARLVPSTEGRQARGVTR